jgi:hypothetical protein
VRPGSRGRNLQDVFAQALAENRERMVDDTHGDETHRTPRDGSESATTTQENDPPTEFLIAQSQNQAQQERATTPKPRKGNGSGAFISGKSKRMSRSPSKRPERAPFEHPSQLAALELRDDINPFQKKGLRRSPPLGSQPPQLSQPEAPIEELIDNPFKRTGLRRSPVISQPVESIEESNLQQQTRVEIQRNEIRRSPVTSRTVEVVEDNIIQQQTRLEMERGGLRRSPIAQVIEITEQSRSQHAAAPAIRKGALRRSPIDSRTAHFGGQGSIEPEPLLPDDQGMGSTALRRSSPPVLVTEIVMESEVQAELQAEAQLEAEVQDSTTPTKPYLAQTSSVEVPIEKPSLIPDPLERSAQSAARELSRVTSDRKQESKSNSPRVTNNPRRSVIEEIMNPFITRRFAEPELPPTPPQLGIPDPVVTTPPSGIHDTPSRRSRRRKGLTEKQKSSPLKPKDPRPKEVLSESQLQSQHQRQVKPRKSPIPKDQSRRRRSSRFITSVDPNADKKKERDDLLRQLQQLKADVALANEENQRIRIRAESKKPPAAAPNTDELLAMLLRSSAREPSDKPAPKKSSLLKSMDSFLPFRPRRKPPAVSVSDKPVPSHLPITLDDPLPYLQAFSSLVYTSSVTLLPPTPPGSDSLSQDMEQHIMQKYVINASHPSGLFAARLAMIADSSLHVIRSIDILRLDMNAEIELGAFVRARAASTGAMGKDITVICWAMARWVDVSIQRARFWCAVEEEFGTREARTASMKRKRKRKRKQQIVDDNEEDEKGKGQWTKRQLLPNFGRTSMDLIDEDVELRFEWKLCFDYTGEVESIVTADARIPETCKLCPF